MRGKKKEGKIRGKRVRKEEEEEVGKKSHGGKGKRKEERVKER